MHTTSNTSGSAGGGASASAAHVNVHPSGHVTMSTTPTGHQAVIEVAMERVGIVIGVKGVVIKELMQMYVCVYACMYAYVCVMRVVVLLV